MKLKASGICILRDIGYSRMKRRNLEQLEVNVDLPFTDHRQHDYLHIKSERRKVRKVIVERRRRERIDRCLDQLKQFLTDYSPSNSQNSQLQGGDLCGASNLEKADILELTVDHLRLLRTRTDQQRALGYNRCAREVDQFLRTSCPEGEMRRRLMAFLARRQPPQQSHTLFGRQETSCWSAEMSTGLDEHRLSTSVGFETMVTDRRTEFSVIRYPSLVNRVEQPSPFNRVQQPSPINHVQSAVVDTTISEDRRVESEEDDEFAEREEEDKNRQSNVTKPPTRKNESPESSVCSRSAVHDFSEDSIRLAERDSTDDVVIDTVRGSDDQESLWRPW